MAFIHLAMRTMSMGDMLLDIMITHPLLRRKRPARVPQPSILPPEIMNAILARCEDRSTLLVCSLVCTSWASISREHLHLPMSLDSRARSARLGHLLRSPVQTLTQSAYCARFSGLDYGQHWRVVRLLHLRGAKIRSAILTGDARAVPFLIQYFPDIVDLTFETNAIFAVLSGQVNPAQELSRFLSKVARFKSLRSLALNVEYVGHLTLDDSESSDILPITRLSLRGKWSGDLISWMQKTCRRLKTLELLAQSGWDSKDTASVEIILRANAQTLRHLQLTVAGSLNLSVVNNIRSLLLKLSEDSSACFDSVTRTLQSLDPLRSPRKVRIQPAKPGGWFSDEQIAAYAEVMARLGLMLVETERYTLNYVHVGLGV
ncbi:hypothetical protein BDZ89DRAFT_1134321 [Hymenopellis radicata]|nr:hypothetical protein BDZ89DRAFT_1134321 [Hymenopellis radicata]